MKRSGKFCAIPLLLLMLIAFGSAIGNAQSPSAPATMPAKLPDASTQSELVENPVTFRLVQLAIVETSLKLVDEAIQKAGGQANRDAMKASNYQKNNELMDRKAGGPLAWDKFYGKTAEGFFYHPVDPNTTYHNPKPIAQRPPQLDYIYKANGDQIQQAKDEIAALGGKIDKLADRKRQLEKQQVALWGQISASLVAQRDLNEQPLYGFQLKIDGTDTDRSLARRAEAIEAFAQFLRVLDKAANYVDQTMPTDQASALATLKQNLETARKTLVRDLANSISSDSVIREQTEPLNDLSKRLTQVTASAVETRDEALAADTAGDDSQKLSSRSLLQTAMMDFADKTALLDDGVVKLAADWKVKPDTGKPLPEVTLVNLTVSSTSGDSSPQSTQASGRSSNDRKKHSSTSKVGNNEFTKSDPSTADGFQPGSVWTAEGKGQHGHKFTITIAVVERNGNNFKARFEGTGRSGEIQGSVEDGKIAWTFDELDRGKKSSGETSGTIGQEEISITKNANGGLPYTLTLTK